MAITSFLSFSRTAWSPPHSHVNTGPCTVPHAAGCGSRSCEARTSHTAGGAGPGLGLSAAWGAAPRPAPARPDPFSLVGRQPGLGLGEGAGEDWTNGPRMGEGPKPETPDPPAPLQEVGSSPKWGHSTPATACARELRGPGPSLQPRHPQASQQEAGQRQPPQTLS